MDLMTRRVGHHAYAAPGPGPGQQIHGAVRVHEPTAQLGDAGTTPLNQPHAPLYASDGAPFYNTGYVYPPRGPLLTGGSLGLHLPPEAGQIDLTDTTTWDRPVYMYGQR